MINRKLLTGATVITLIFTAVLPAMAQENEDGGGNQQNAMMGVQAQVPTVLPQHLSEQYKKMMEANREIEKQSAEAYYKNDENSSMQGQQPASLNINPNGDIRITNATVITVSPLTVKTWGLIFTVNTDAQTKFSARGGNIATTDIQAGDKVSINGTTNDSTPGAVLARQVEDLSKTGANTDAISKIRAQIQMLMDKLNQLIAQQVGTTPAIVVPSLASLSPATAVATSTGFTLTVNGSNFTANSTVKWASSALATTFVSASQLTALVPASTATATGTVSITVVNPGTTGGTSNALTFSITSL